MKIFPRLTTSAFLFTIAATQATFAEEGQFSSCHAVNDAEKRLACYDEATGYEKSDTVTKATKPDASATEASQGRQWVYSDEKSALDGRKDIWLRVSSENTQPNQIGSPESATLWVRCMKNSTNVLIGFNSYTTDDQTVRYRLDEDKMRSVWMQTIKGGDGIGLWSGSRAIPFIKGMFGKDKLVIGYSSYSSNNLEFTFDISGLRARIPPLAEACHWAP
jgi:type VI secretion system protein VasI